MRNAKRKLTKEEQAIIDWETRNDVSSLCPVEGEELHFSYSGCDVLGNGLGGDVILCVARDNNGDEFEVYASWAAVCYFANGLD